MTDNEIVAWSLENEWSVFHPVDELCYACHVLSEEIKQLRSLNHALAERVAAQSELLSRKAEIDA